jgi:protein-glutamine gamma-glutamyltransferase
MKQQRNRPELESTLLAMIAAVPLYVTGPIEIPAVFFFHVVMAVIAVGFRRGLPLQLSPTLMGLLGFSYLLFFPVDAIVISRSLIRASTHLLFFIAVYQGFEAAWKDNQGQRILVTFLIFVTSIATSTHIAVVLFVLIFAVLAFRELMTMSSRETAGQTGQAHVSVGHGKQAVSYLLPTLLIAILFFPLLPRLRNPFVQGPTSMLTDQATGIRDTIDLSEASYGSDDPGIVARVWMGADALPFFTPIRLKVAVYDTYDDGRWQGSKGNQGQVWARHRGGPWLLARPEGISTRFEIQQRPTRDRELFLPVGTYSVEEIDSLFWGSGIDTVVSPEAGRNLRYTVNVSKKVIPFVPPEPRGIAYPYDERIMELAREVVGAARTPREMAAKIETWMTTTFDYLPNTIDREPMTLEQFLFEERRGHCEYFAAGMVVLLGALDVPARIVGGFYGGDLNPLGRYFAVRRSDAHAWVELYDGTAWLTYDPTPPDLRPGASTGAAIVGYLGALSDAVIYFWDRYVLTYGLSDQVAFALAAIERLRDLIVSIRTTRLSFGMPRAPTTFIVIFSVIIFGMILRSLRLYQQGIFEQMTRQLERLGHRVQPSTSGRELLEDLEQKAPAIAVNVAAVLQYHELERYSGRKAPERTRQQALDALRELRRTRGD